MWNEFRKFIARGNMIDLAVGIVIGAAFSTVVSSLVNDVLMPPFGLLLGGVDFANLYINLGGTDYETLEAALAAGAPLIKYGVFLNSVISFLIVGFTVFLLVKGYNRLREQPAPPPAVPTEKDCPFCLKAIPIAATRCAHCTSQLGAVVAQA
jgi:large conductance mechanosensitive channel